MSAPGPTPAPSHAGRWIAVAAAVAVAAVIAAAIAVIGPPSRQRLLRLDERRTADLERVAAAVSTYHGQHGRLPASLAEVAAEPGLRLPKDPQSGREYGYGVLAQDEYRLCADFATDTTTDGMQPWRDAAWPHGAGRHCFKRRVRAAQD